MRKQYHSRVIDARLLIWDVHRLVELAKPLPVKTVPLSSIRELDDSFWFERESPTCREVAAHAKLIAETDLKYSIILSAGGRVMDGMYRVCKAFINNSDTLSAVQFAVNPHLTTSTPTSRHYRMTSPKSKPKSSAQILVAGEMSLSTEWASSTGGAIARVELNPTTVAECVCLK